VPVVGYGTDDFPAFYLTTSGRPVSARVDSPEEAAALLKAHWSGLGTTGVVLAQPLPVRSALDPQTFALARDQAEEQARQAGIRGPALTPFLLARLAELTDGKTLEANRALIVANARLAARVALALSEEA
jgi:pseudouridine-5'-phosphate glycosidase